MKNGRLIMIAFLAAAVIASPVRGWQVTAEDHATHHPGTQAAAPKTAPPAAVSTRLDELLDKMQAAQGQAKVDAMAELLTALVQSHQAMHADMSTMMQNMGGMRRK